MRGRRPLLFLCLAYAGAPAGAQTIVSSAGPERVAVTVYRDPERAPDRPPNLQWLNGFALISETRPIAIPAGESEIRFEGVAGGILPQSAIVTGLPEGIVERNQDAYLLSPGTLIDRSLGRRVHLRRTSRATGAVTEQDAIVRSGLAGAVIVQTESGFEALRCTGQSETLLHDEVPPGLSARPTLSVRARSSRPVAATVTLSYLAAGLDWQADYVATLAPDGSSIRLFAWLTLANSDETGFAGADTQAIAGRVNRVPVGRILPQGPPLFIRCWDNQSTSDIPEEEIYVSARQPPLQAVAAMTSIGGESFMMAEQENLGDLKLYRIPEPVTVAARSQKQVALLQRDGVPVRFIYRQNLFATFGHERQPARRFLHADNSIAGGLGLPLPAGRLALFDSRGARPILMGEGTMLDRAVGEEVEVDLGPAPGVITEVRVLDSSPAGGRYLLVVTNSRDRPVEFEATIFENGKQFRSATRLARDDNVAVWQVTIPANSALTLRYALVTQGRRR